MHSSVFLGRKALNHELSKLFNEMWDADVHRLRPGRDYTIDVQVTNCQGLRAVWCCRKRCLQKCLLLKKLPVVCHIQWGKHPLGEGTIQRTQMVHTYLDLGYKCILSGVCLGSCNISSPYLWAGGGTTSVQPFQFCRWQQTVVMKLICSDAGLLFHWT